MLAFGIMHNWRRRKKFSFIIWNSIWCSWFWNEMSNKVSTYYHMVYLQCRLTNLKRLLLKCLFYHQAKFLVFIKTATINKYQFLVFRKKTKQRLLLVSDVFMSQHCIALYPKITEKSSRRKHATWFLFSDFFILSQSCVEYGEMEAESNNAPHFIC